MVKKSIWIYPCIGCVFDYECGGITCCFEIAKYMSDLGIDVRIEDISRQQNHIYNNFITENIIETNIENIIVIYGETVTGNPLNARYVVRWILGPYANI